MVKAVVIGDGPAGLSAALFLAKNGVETVVYEQDATAMHYAQLHNYLGVPDVSGTEFQRVAREQAAEQGAVLRKDEVAEVERDGDGFTVRTVGGAAETADYVVLAVGKTGQQLAEALGAELGERGVVADADGRTSVDKVYAVGRIARLYRSQAVISAGAGASAALDILSREAGKDVKDWDSPPEGGR